MNIGCVETWLSRHDDAAVSIVWSSTGVELMATWGGVPVFNQGLVPTETHDTGFADIALSGITELLDELDEAIDVGDVVDPRRSA